MLFNIKPLPPVKIPTVTFTGTKKDGIDGDNWEYAFLTSGTITFDSPPGDCDIFLVANGKDGGPTSYQSSGIAEGYYYGGRGGDGGNYLVTRMTLEAGVAYTLTIGENTTLVGTGVNLSTANGNAGADGGARGSVRADTYNYNGNINAQPKAGKPGIYAYNDPSDTVLVPEFRGKTFCAGGGGGDGFYATAGLFPSENNDGGSNTGGDGSQYRSTAPADTDKRRNASPGAENSGSGGGGGRRSADGYDTNSAAGGTGVCFIRKHIGG